MFYLKSSKVIGLSSLLVTVALTGLFTYAADAAPARGSLDQSFGTAGTTIFRDTGNVILRSLVVQPDDKIVVGGGISPLSAGTKFMLGRVQANGSIDSTFGSSGRVSIEIGPSATLYSLTLQPDGKIIAAGFYRSASSLLDFVVVRLLSSGALDPSFGTSGITRVDIDGGDDWAASAVLLADGSILVAGTTGMPPIGNPLTRTGGRELALVKLTPGGVLDSSFGKSGITTSQVGGDEGTQIIRVIDGKIVLAGSVAVSYSPDDTDVILVRLKTDGFPDLTFGASGVGRVRTALGGEYDTPYGLAPLGTNRYAVVGQSFSGGTSDGFLLSYLSTGTLDAGFGTAGKVIVDFAGSSDTLTGILVTADGGLVVVGSTNAKGTYDFLLSRYSSKGVRDSKFGANGIVITDLGPSGSESSARIAAQSSGKIIVAGTSTAGGDQDFVILRYNP